MLKYPVCVRFGHLTMLKYPVCVLFGSSDYVEILGMSSFWII